MDGWKAERRIDRGRFEVLVDLNERTNERRVSVYRGDTLLAIEFIQPLDSVVERLVETAKLRAPQFPV